MMRRAFRALGVVATAGVLAACNDYFTGPGVDTDPNNPSTATADQLFVGFQGFTFYNLTGDLARLTSMFDQQMAGTGRQWQGYDKYQLTENDFSWDGYYTGGGLVDLRQVQSIIADDKIYLGVTQVWEALTIGTAADLWGKIPYSEANDPQTHPQPILDSQLAVYAALQTLLDQAITNLSGGGLGPGTADLVYSGDADAWIAAAHTLKARLYLHTAEVNPGDYANALAETAQGISDASGDFTTYQSGTKGEENHWFQFRVQRGTDMSAGKYLVDLMTQRNDPRLTEYFSAGPEAGGVIIGAVAGIEEYDGTQAWLGPVRGAADFRQPVITYAENQLIRAEAQYKTNDESGALETVNDVRADIGMTPVNKSGPELYNQIMEEKYIALFQNIESWNDYKRTCYPNVDPADGSDYIPARLFYGTNERNANPNIPPPSLQPLRNENDPSTPTDPLGNACKGQGS